MNNYNCNKDGLSIEVNLYYDTDYSRFEFEENTMRLNNPMHNQTSIFLYTSYGEISENDIKLQVKGTKKELARFLDIDYMSKQELIDEILAQYSIVELLTDNQLFDGYEIEIKSNAEIFVTRGYSQGDYAEVVVLRDALAKIWGKKPTTNELQNMIDQMFWDTPINGNIIIDGNEEQLSNILSDGYISEDDVKEELIEWVKKNFDAKQWEEIISMIESIKVEWDY